jgi:ATP-dependent Zn protease
MSGNIFNMIVFDKIKTGNPLFDSTITILIVSCATFLFQYLNNYVLILINVIKECNFNINSWFKNKYTVEYDGKISTSTNVYDNTLRQSSVFSDRFKALCRNIIENTGDNKTINSIKEYSFDNSACFDNNQNNNNNNNNKNNKNNKNIDVGIYLVVQKGAFLISNNLQIYATTNITNESKEQEIGSNKNTATSAKIDKITIQLFSYKSDINMIKNFVEELTLNYISDIEELRDKKRYIYTLIKAKFEKTRFELWDEIRFSSTRQFSNIFFKGKEDIIKKIDFFLNNKNWFYEKGIPYSLGIGMHGQPGTGKTSLIKAVGNYTNRHIIVISLKVIKTKGQLDSIFFEERYNIDNKNGIDFDKKIIVFEDIDCIGDIVMDREKKKNKFSTELCNKDSNINSLTMGDLIETITAAETSNEKMCASFKLPKDEEPITLDDILNLWDGIRETPGRIMFISSNHYYDLDPALIRPGRIDITLELSYASRQIIKDMYKHLFNESIDEDKIKLIKEHFYSPAEIINIYMNGDRNSERFITRLMMNEHV